MHTDFTFPNVGDAIEICLDGFRGRRFEVRGVTECRGRSYVYVYLPCDSADCTRDDHDMPFPVTAVRPWRAS